MLPSISLKCVSALLVFAGRIDVMIGDAHSLSGNGNFKHYALEGKLRILRGARQVRDPDTCKWISHRLSRHRRNTEKHQGEN